MATVTALTDIERAYLRDQPLGRLATVDASGARRTAPSACFSTRRAATSSSAEAPWAEPENSATCRSNPHVAVVVDDLVSTDPWTVRGLEVRGTALALSDVDPPVPFMSREIIRITPTWVASWGLDPERPGKGDPAKWESQTPVSANRSG